jgi:hypothetical protein
MSEGMNRATIAEPLLVLLASGGTVERTVADLPAFKSQIEAAFDWMRSNAQCSPVEVEHLAERLRELIRRKDVAVRGRDFGVAAEVRAEECALFESLGLKAPTGETWHTVLYAGIEEQTCHLSALLSEMQGSGCEPDAPPNGGPATSSGNSGASGGPPSVS